MGVHQYAKNERCPALHTQMYHICMNSGFWGSLTVANFKLRKTNQAVMFRCSRKHGWNVDLGVFRGDWWLLEAWGIHGLRWQGMGGVSALTRQPRWRSHLATPSKVFSELYFIVVGFDHPPHHLHLLHECFTFTNEWVSEWILNYSRFDCKKFV